MRRAGLGDAPRTLLEEFAKIKSPEVVLPAQMADGSRQTIHLRRVATPVPKPVIEKRQRNSYSDWASMSPGFDPA